jgi:hypothetical protein
MEKSTTEKVELKDGIYKNENATYFVKSGKVVMRLMGSFYMTTENFMVGARFVQPFSITQEEFDEQCKGLKNW